MKGDMGQEDRQALDINLDSVASYSCELGLMSIAARLLKNGCTDMGSFVVSPACLYIAVETLARGAKGETLNELESVLGGAEARRDACSLLFAKDPEQTASDYRLAIATSLWANKFTSPLRRNFGRTIADLHGKAAEVDFESSEAKALMSSWLSKNTSGKFTSAPEMDADTVFAIISALYFKDSWVDPLDDEDIEVVFRAPEPQSDVAMMGGFGSYGHLLSTRETTAVSWPMQSGAVAVFARSNNGATLDDFVQSGAAWDAILRCHMRMGTTRPKGGIELFVPQFELRSDDRDLGGMLRSLGIEKIFSPGADFGNITEAGAMVSRVVQNAVLKLDPNGAEGAAYTIFAVPAGCAPESMPEPVRVVFDRPFAFAIFSHSGAPLFVGVYGGA